MKKYIKPVLRLKEKNDFVYEALKSFTKKDITCNQCSSCHGCRG